MKKYIILLIVPIFLYLLFSFVPYQFNPAKWTEELRGLYVWIVFVIESTVFLIFYVQQL